MKKKLTRFTLFILLLLSTFTFILASCGQNANNAQNISPTVNISGNYKWKHVDTELCRLYYYQDEEFVRGIASSINDIYKEVCQKLKHAAKPKEDGRILVIFLDDAKYKSYTGDTSAGAGWRNDGGFINLNKKDSPSINSTLRHELIHAVTLYSGDSKLKDCPGWFADGIAQYYQNNINNGKFDESMIKDAVLKNEIVPWDQLVPRSGSWGKEKRPLKYWQSACIYEFLIKQYGEDSINNIFYTDASFEDAFKKVAGKTVEEAETEWIAYISKKYN